MPDTSSSIFRIGFAGSPEFAATILSKLNLSQAEVVAVLTQPDKPKGRGRRMEPSPVKVLAEAQGIPVYQPQTLRTQESQTLIEGLNLDVLVVAAYGQILPQAVLDAPTFGCINVHASLLPRWRGAAPIERAVMAGDLTTGVCIMQMEAGLDTGPVYSSQATAIDLDSDITALEDTLANTGAELLLGDLERFVQAKQTATPAPVPKPQAEEGVTYAHKLTAKDRSLNWHDSAIEIARQVWALQARLPVRQQVHTNTAEEGAERGGTLNIQLLACREVRQQELDQHSVVPTEPGSVCLADRKRVWIQCGEGVVAVLTVRPESGKGSILPIAAARNGYSNILHVGAQFSNIPEK